MLLLARLCKSSDHRFRPRLIFTVGETLDIEAREFINSAFDTKVRDNYSCIEFGHLAWECPSNMGYHINTDCAVMEFVNDGEQVSPGERGEIVCTGLINHAMPLLRYELGDVAIPEEESCTCGVTLPLMRSVEGRRDDFLVATDGRLISPLAFSAEPIEKGISGLRQYRIVQEKTDKVIIEIALQKENELPNQESLRQARKGMKDLLGQDMQVEFAIVQNIDKGSTGKVRRLISHLPREHRTIDLQKTMAESETTNTA
jgi:phenylacetate-CoA ligase